MSTVRVQVPDAPAHPRSIRLDDWSVELIDGPDAHAVTSSGRPRKLTVVDVGSAPVPKDGPSRRLLVYGDGFADSDIGRLVDLQAVGIDRAGSVVVAIDKQPLVVRTPRFVPTHPDRDHVEHLTLPRVRGRALSVSGGYGVASIRLAQSVLAEPRDWTPSDLAEDGDCSLATASRLLSRLSRLGFASGVSDGRHKRYRFTELSLLADWVDADLDPTKRRDRSIDGFLRARSPRELVEQLHRRLSAAGGFPVFTGSAASTFADQVDVVSAVPVVTVRVQPDCDLPDLLKDAGLSPGATGANVRLLADTGSVGAHRARVVDEILFAPQVRTWLDLRHELRGRDAADLYRETILDQRWVRT